MNAWKEYLQAEMNEAGNKALSVEEVEAERREKRVDVYRDEIEDFEYREAQKTED